MSNNRKTAEAYDAGAEWYHAHVSDPSDSVHHAYYEKPAIRGELPDLGGLDVISLGCGSGVDTRWLADEGADRVVGIDISEELIKIARNENPELEFHEMDMEQLDFEDDSFDLAYSSLAIHYLKDWTKSLKEVRRVLRAGGHFVFSCDHPINSAMQYSKEGDVSRAVLGREVNRDTGEQKTYGDYLANEHEGNQPIKSELGSMKVTVYRKTFAVMVEQILSSELTIARVVEPQPIDDSIDRLAKIPLFMIWVLKNNA